MRPFIFFFSIGLFLTGCSTGGQHKKKSDSCALKKEGQVIPLISGIQVIRFVFENGLRLLVVENRSSPTFAYQSWFRVGSRDEEPGRTGLAHLFEHMMFKETKNLKDGEFDRLLESAGAQGENAFTSRDYTAYIQELPQDQLELIVRAESDRMHHLVINQHAFETEREVVQNERRFRTENSPDGLMNQELFELAFTKHPYHWPIIGYEKDLNQMNSEDARLFYLKHYSPNHATIVVVGDVCASQVYSLAQKYYGTLPPQNFTPSNPLNEPIQTNPRKKQLKLNIQVEKLLVAYPIPAFTHPDIPALQVLRSLVGLGKSSRLNQALIETGVASSVDLSELDDKDPSLLIIAVDLQHQKRATQAESIILKEFDRLAKNSVSQHELERAKNKINFDTYSGLGSNFQLAQFLGSLESIAGDFVVGMRQIEKIQSVTAQEVQAVAQRYLNLKGRTVIIGVPK